jgi:hypothetical protein
MAHEFKPGDLALIVGCVKSPINVGKSCTLKQFVGAGETIYFPHECGGRSMLGVTNTGGRGWLVLGDTLLSSQNPIFGWSLVRPDHLLPLKGDEQPAQVCQAERVQ